MSNITNIKDLQDAHKGSYYTILGAGGDLNEWVNGYEQLMEKEIGKPTVWYSTTGAAVNDYIRPSDARDLFDDDLTILLFPLDRLNAGKLALFKLQMEDRWFDDIVDNARARG